MPLFGRTAAPIPLKPPNVWSFHLPDLRIMRSKGLTAQVAGFAQATEARLQEFVEPGREFVIDLLPTAFPGPPDEEIPLGNLARVAAIGFAAAVEERDRGWAVPGQVDGRVGVFLHWSLNRKLGEEIDDAERYRLFTFMAEAAYFYARTGDLATLQAICVRRPKDVP